MRTVLIAGLMGALLAPPLSAAAEGERELKIATSFMQMLVAAREVIARKQEMINDEKIGDKGFNKESFNKNLQAIYFRLFGKNLLDKDAPPEAGVFLGAMEEVIDEAQPSLNQKGVGFKNFIPAIFVKRVAEKINKKFVGHKLKLTSIPDVHNPSNAPDDWERKILEYFLGPDYPHGRVFSEVTGGPGKRVLRLMQPEYFNASCLVCHGFPKGELGPGGIVKCGKQLGQAGAGLSLAIPIKK